MNTSLVITIIWVLAVSCVGMLPRDYHKRLGFPMLALFPFVLGYLAWDLGPYWALALLAAAASIFRYPAKYYGLALWRKLAGRPAVE